MSASSTGCGAWPFATVAECVCCRGIGSPSTEPIRRSSRRWPHRHCTKFVVDGEIVAFEGRRTSFARLQGRLGSHRSREALATGHSVFYYMFDLIHLDACTTTDLPLSRRKRLLRDTFQFTIRFGITTHRVKNGEAAYTAACRRGDEGVIAKLADAPYEGTPVCELVEVQVQPGPGVRHRRLHRPEGQSRRTGSATARATTTETSWSYAGKVGTGFDPATLRSLHKRLSRTEQTNHR